MAIFPPRSTNTLQPLDVVLFRSLSAEYSTQLTTRTHKSRDLLLVKKGDFFKLFWQSWLNSFTEDRIKKAFSSTGIQPLNREQTLKDYKPKQLEEPSSPHTPPLQLEGASARVLMCQFDLVVADKTSSDAAAFRVAIHCISIQNELMKQEISNLSDALKVKNKQNKKSRALDVSKHDLKYWGGAQWHYATV